MKIGDTFNCHVCNECQYKQKNAIKKPADSGKRSLLCDICGHYGIGSNMRCIVVDWLRVKII